MFVYNVLLILVVVGVLYLISGILFLLIFVVVVMVLFSVFVLGNVLCFKCF